MIEKQAFGGSHTQRVAATRHFLAEHSTCEAALFANNSLTIYALEAIAELGLRIPQDLAIVSFNDKDLFRLYSPAITVVTQPVATLAEAAITVLLDKLSNDNARAPACQQLALPISLVVRKSSLRVGSLLSAPGCLPHGWPEGNSGVASVFWYFNQ